MLILKKNIRQIFSDKKFHEILTGSFWALTGRVVSTGLGLFSTVIIARWFGPDSLGMVAMIQSFLMLATIFTIMGTDTSILRLIPEHLVKYSPTSAFKVYRKTVFIVLCISLVTSILFICMSRTIADSIFKKPHLYPYFSLATFFIIFRSLTNLNTSAIRGLRMIRTFALMHLLPQGYNLFLLALLSIFIFSPDVPVYAFLGSVCLTCLTGWLILEYGFKKQKCSQDLIYPVQIREILTISMPMFMTSAMAFIVSQTGVLILGIFKTEIEVGYYAIAVKLATLTSFILSAVNSMAAPKFSELYHSNNIDELFYVAKKSSKLIFITTTPLLFGFILLGKPLLHFIFGSDFTVAYIPMVLIVIGQFINSISGSTGLFMNMTGNQIEFRNIVISTAILNITLCIILIPKLGINGAAISTMICTSLWNILTLYYIKNKFGKSIGYFPFFYK